MSYPHRIALGDFGYALICDITFSYIPIIGVLSFLLWYRPIYNGYMKVSLRFVKEIGILMIWAHLGASHVLL